MSVQHTHPEVLDAIKRKNLTREEVDELIAFHREHGLSMLVQLILGCPNDTYPKWKQCLTDLMEWGIDGQYEVANFQILPNAPAADPGYLEEWEIELETTENILKPVVDDETPVPDLAKKNVIVSTKTFDRDDWVRMWTYTHFVRCFHTMGLSHRLALFLRYGEDVSFLQFYEGLVDEFARREGSVLRECVRRIAREKRDFLSEKDASLDRTRLKLLPESAYEPQWNEWIFIHTVLNRHEIYDELTEWLVQRFPVREDRLRDLVEYQRKIVVNPDYDPRFGKSFEGQYDWVEYFQRDRDQLVRPPRERPRRFEIDQSSLGSSGQYDIRWHEKQGDERLEAWIEGVVKNLPYLPDYKYRNRTVTLHEVESAPPNSLLRRLRSTVRRSLERVASGQR